uniref:Uncharacterized protein n=1 Tax=Anguilla anguilla TaxID=7936 RepID=A0A0E9TB04_ANGAN
MVLQKGTNAIEVLHRNR